MVILVINLHLVYIIIFEPQEFTGTVTWAQSLEVTTGAVRWYRLVETTSEKVIHPLSVVAVSPSLGIEHCLPFNIQHFQSFCC